MSLFKSGSLLINQSIKTFQYSACFFSRTSILEYNKHNFRKKWHLTDSWDKVKSGDDKIDWLSSLPRTFNSDKWTQDEACFGAYDFVKILGNDVTLKSELFCEGSDYVRAYKANELRRLLVKRKRLGHRMHIEDLDTMEKRIRYLMTVFNRRKRKSHG